MVRSITAVATLAVAAALFQVSDAHTNMVAPKPKFPDGFYNGNSPYSRLDSTKFTGAGADIPGYQGVKKIAALMGTSTLRDFVYKNAKITQEGATMECGKTLMTGTPVAVPDEIDFPWGHLGPCEAWCDDTKIFSNGDCQGNNVGKIKVDKAKCANAKRLQVMYAGVHVENYEIYSNCVPLTGSGSGGDSTGADATKAPTPAATPTPATDAPETYEPSPAATTKAPTPAATPTTTKKSCNRRLRN